jgi:uncharacterized FAD-dependent dehydrogenase
MKRVTIIGAGPAGIFAANTLAEKCEVTILEKRDFVGGSGLHSDGKLNFHPQIGGDLTEFIPAQEAWDLVKNIQDTFARLGVKMAHSDKERLKQMTAKAAQAGIKFIEIEQNHIGSDFLPAVISRMETQLKEKGVNIHLETPANEINVDKGLVKSVTGDGEEFKTDAVLLAPGRIGIDWLIEQMNKHGVAMDYNPIDVGVRVEVPNEVMDEVIHGYKVWDPKFHLFTPSYDDFVRTFCVCPSGFVVRESYGEDSFGVNGHSMRRNHSGNTNFALLTRVSLTEPLENTTLYGRRIAQLTNTLGGGQPILQRLGDLKTHRRSTWERIERSYVDPTLRQVTPGDLSMAYPNRIIKNITEGLEMLDRVIPGINSESTLLYGPEIKFYAMRIQTDQMLRTKIPNLYVAGDGAGVSRGIVGAAATGIIAAQGILKQ